MISLLKLDGLVLVDDLLSFKSSLQTISWRPPTAQLETLAERMTEHQHHTTASLEIDDHGRNRLFVDCGTRCRRLISSPQSIGRLFGDNLIFRCWMPPASVQHGAITYLPPPCAFLEEFGDHRIDYDSRRLIHSAYSSINITAIASTTIFLPFAEQGQCHTNRR
ncbi:hypothetical protein ARMGADRAFT_1082990 [Armillaria gallica]|uniref:Uncharacterized protein n=1 Tax=Armillaria gallica TaxID=47427 RepID=A0A2H3D8L3_ARMGA|nr:hypothetical protein ARMGADRAFT_1082990 [Armillaria gallica]